MNRDKLLLVVALLVLVYAVVLALGAIWLGASASGAIPEVGIELDEDGSILEVKTKDEFEGD